MFPMEISALQLHELILNSLFPGVQSHPMICVDPFYYQIIIQIYEWPRLSSSRSNFSSSTPAVLCCLAVRWCLWRASGETLEKGADWNLGTSVLGLPSDSWCCDQTPGPRRNIPRPHDSVLSPTSGFRGRKSLYELYGMRSEYTHIGR